MAYFNSYSRFYKWRAYTLSAWRMVWRFSYSRQYLLGVFVVQLIAWLQAGLIYRGLTSGFLILHYNVSLGVDLVGEARQVFLYPLFGLAVALVNSIILSFWHRARDFQILAHLLLAAALIFNLLISAALFSIYLTNFRY